MHSIHATIIAALGAIAAASPLLPRQSSGYVLYVEQAEVAVAETCINANDGKFWNQRPTAVGCPSSIDCSGFPNITTVAFGNQEAYMAANVPGGQDIYIAPDGAVSFTEPHEEGVYPKGSYEKTFALSQDYVDFSGGNAKGFALCGDSGQLYALIDNNGCGDKQNKIALKVKPYSGLGAFQFE